MTSLPELYLKIQKIYSVNTNKKRDFYELWQQHKQLKTLEMKDAWYDTYDEGYIHQFQTELIHRIY